jgi:casein kinase II subunit alpha
MYHPGRGRHAIVFECHDPRERVYAMKLYKQESRNRINREIEVLQHLRLGPNIVQLIDIVQGHEVCPPHLLRVKPA